ncbi:MAG: nucleotide-binding protein [Thaumarchaeota archaeon]|nr:nucleotide-binding protein [Nitrososphaerota archaeon]
MSEPALVLDSTAFYAGIPYQGNGRYFTTYLVLEEIKHHSVGSSLIHTRVQVTEPSAEAIERVRSTAKQTGDAGALSQTDLSLLALALDLSKGEGGASLVSDDFAVRNVAEVLSIPLSKTALKGGEWKNVTWRLHCKGCGKQYTNPKLTQCPVCGTQLVRKGLTS